VYQKGPAIYPAIELSSTEGMIHLDLEVLVGVPKLNFSAVIFADIHYKQVYIPSRDLTYPTWGEGKSSSKCHFWEIC